jgi:hypothetical protein
MCFLRKKYPVLIINSIPWDDILTVYYYDRRNPTDIYLVGEMYHGTLEIPNTNANVFFYSKRLGRFSALLYLYKGSKIHINSYYIKEMLLD